jgi:hypothetical protein
MADQIKGRRARVFISCGQTKDSDELETAQKIRDRLQELGFDPYIAVEEQTLSGLKENIFRQLQTAEYFVFVDFKRERLLPRTMQVDPANCIPTTPFHAQKIGDI